MAGSKGLEPSASGVTGRRYNHLNYDPFKQQKISAYSHSSKDFLILHMVGGTGLEPVTSTV